MEKPNRHIWEEDSTHRSVAGDEYDEVWDYAEQLEAENKRMREGLRNEGNRIIKALEDYAKDLDKLSVAAKDEA